VDVRLPESLSEEDTRLFEELRDGPKGGAP
jgi:hypothetical protein